MTVGSGSPRTRTPSVMIEARPSAHQLGLLVRQVGSGPRRTRSPSVTARKRGLIEARTSAFTWALRESLGLHTIIKAQECIPRTVWCAWRYDHAAAGCRPACAGATASPAHTAVTNKAITSLKRQRLLPAPTHGGRDKARIQRCKDICTRFTTRSALVAGADVSR